MDEDIYDPAFVADLFDRCSTRYRNWAAIASFGFVPIWRRQCVDRLEAQAAISRHKHEMPVNRAPQVVDLMAGTGEVWPNLLKVMPNARITAIDISKSMHEQALEHLHGGYAARIRHLQADVLTTDLPEHSADLVVSTFGLKTLTKTGQTLLAERINSVLRPGGAFCLIEASDPKGWMLRPLYRMHLDIVLPLIERIALRGAQDFAMLGIYTSRFKDCGHFADALRDQGLFASQRKHFFGCATSVAGFKPVAESADSA